MNAPRGQIADLFEEVAPLKLDGAALLGWTGAPDRSMSLFVADSVSASGRYDAIIRVLEYALEQFRSALPDEDDTIH